MSTAKTNITRSFDARRWSHLQDFQMCHECKKDFDFARGDSSWKAHAVSLVLAEVYGRHAAAVVVMECPGCGTKHWVHQDLDGFTSWSKWPEGWAEAAKAELDRRVLHNIQRFASSACWNCKHLTGYEANTLGWKKCHLSGSWPVVRCKDWKLGKVPVPEGENK